MTTASSPPLGPRVRCAGATAVGDTWRRRVAQSLRALRVFVSSALGVILLGEYAGHDRTPLSAARG